MLFSFQLLFWRNWKNCFLDILPSQFSMSQHSCSLERQYGKNKKNISRPKIRLNCFWKKVQKCFWKSGFFLHFSGKNEKMLILKNLSCIFFSYFPWGFWKKYVNIGKKTPFFLLILGQKSKRNKFRHESFFQFWFEKTEKNV